MPSSRVPTACLRATVPPCLARSAFTLTEILVVIGIIVLLLVLAVPAFNWITGSRSIDGAENIVSATLGRARGEALGLQQDTGVLFLIDPASQRIAMAEVYNTAGSADPAILDLVPDRDLVLLPAGVSAQVIDNFDPTETTDDRYIGYNTDLVGGNSTTVKYGGVIFFDGNGRLVSRAFAFRAKKPDGNDAQINLLLNDVPRTGTAAAANMIPAFPAALGNQRSAFGLVLFDRDAFANNGNDSDPQMAGGSAETGEESWIDGNSVPLLINRFNGTLVRSE